MLGTMAAASVNNGFVEEYCPDTPRLVTVHNKQPPRRPNKRLRSKTAVVVVADDAGAEDGHDAEAEQREALSTEVQLWGGNARCFF